MASLTRGLQLLASAVRYALAGAGLVTPPLLSCPTPCADWDLEVLLDHVSDSAGVLHQAITAGCAGPAPPSDDRPPGLDPVRGLHRQTARLLASCAAAGPAPRLVAIGDRELTTNMVALAGALEITVHGWDIAVACGRCTARPAPVTNSPFSQAVPRRFRGVRLVCISRAPQRAAQNRKADQR